MRAPRNPKSRKWRRIVKRGCGGYKIETMDGTEYDCRHPYDWTCDDCPVCQEAQERKYKEHNKRLKSFVGPSEPEYFQFLED